jgi:ABC-type lipoprotein release transport system permease subunit
MLLLLAWRNIWRNRHRSWITMASVAGAVVLAVLMASLQKGVFEHLIKNVVSLYTGYVQVHAKGYWKEQVLENSFEWTADLNRRVSSWPGVALAAPRLEAFALASSGEKTRGCLVVGVEPEQEDRITALRSKVAVGDFLSEDRPGILVAGGLAEKLDLQLGDTLVLLSQGYYGSTAAGKYAIRGLLHFGSPELNNSVAYLSLPQAQTWLDAPGRVTALALGLQESADPVAVTADLRGALDTAYEVMSWEDMMPDIVQHIQSDTIGMYIFLGVLYLVIAFGIFSTLLMMYVERRREFGMLVALGMRKARIAGMILAESVMLTMSGAALGVLLSFPVIWYFAKYPLRFSGEIAKIYEKFGFEAVFPASTNPAVFLIQTTTVLALGLLLALYPAWKVLKINLLESMRK